MAQETWEQLTKNLNDNQRIEEAIDAAIDTHNADTGAHLAANQAIEVHRAESVIDHPAESVVNDKLQPYARAYVAIVDPADDEAFDTIQGAITYALTKGGGTILITPGTHFVSGVVELPMSINLRGTDPETCIISLDRTGGDYLEIVDDLVTDQFRQQIEGLTFFNDAGGCILMNTSTTNFALNIVFTDCYFKNGGNYIAGNCTSVEFRDCLIYCSNVAAIGVYSLSRFVRCRFVRHSTSNGLIGWGSNFDAPDLASVYCFGCIFDAGGATVNPWLLFSEAQEVWIFHSSFSGLDCQSLIGAPNIWIGNEINLHSTGFIDVSGQYLTFVGNSVTGGTGDRLRLGSGVSDGVVVGNNITGGISRVNTQAMVRANKPERDYNPLSTGSTAMGFGLNRTVKVTPNATATYTTTVPISGTRVNLLILTSGTTSYTITFGTGFKSAGTLATGTVSARVFSLAFVSDGTNLYEVSRTGALVA